jgi:LPXTG-site transpeptidase (sortase) family protein
MQQKRKRRSISSIILIIFIVIFIIGGIALIFYPILTDIPSIIKKGSTIAGWQLMKDKFAGKAEENQNPSNTTKTTATNVTGTTIQVETSRQITQTTINEQAQSQNSTSSTKATVAAAAQNNKNIKYKAEDIFPAKLTIPKIDLEWITNEGSEVPDLKKGPGHIPQTPLPGEAGRCTLSGHRTTYGAPFNRIDELKKGDMIYLEALNGNRYFYQVTSFQIVAPTYVEILNGTDRKELLLTTCYPEYSAKERLVVIAELITVFPLDLNLK